MSETFFGRTIILNRNNRNRFRTLLVFELIKTVMDINSLRDNLSTITESQTSVVFLTIHNCLPHVYDEVSLFFFFAMVSNVGDTV